jgi:hypothetical protein
MNPLIRRLLLLLVLFGAQWAQAAHELDIDWHLTHDHCPVCLAGQGLNGPPVYDQVPVPPRYTDDTPATPAFSCIPSTRRTPAQARAPPTAA